MIILFSRLIISTIIGPTSAPITLVVILCIVSLSAPLLPRFSLSDLVFAWFDTHCPIAWCNMFSKLWTWVWSSNGSVVGTSQVMFLNVEQPARDAGCQIQKHSDDQNGQIVSKTSVLGRVKAFPKLFQRQMRRHLNLSHMFDVFLVFFFPGQNMEAGAQCNLFRKHHVSNRYQVDDGHQSHNPTTVCVGETETENSGPPRQKMEIS